MAGFLPTCRFRRFSVPSVQRVERLSDASKVPNSSDHVSSSGFLLLSSIVQRSCLVAFAFLALAVLALVLLVFAFGVTKWK